jgi:hypothetical protein
MNDYRFLSLAGLVLLVVPLVIVNRNRAALALAGAAG